MRLYLLIGAALFAIGVAVWLRLDYLAGERDRLRDELAVSQQGVTKLQETIQLTEQAFTKRDQLDEQNTKELKVLRDENKRLADCVATGDCWLFVNAACPAVPADPGAARVDAAGAAELAADARSDYFALRDELALSRQMILGLQQYAHEVCRR